MSRSLIPPRKAKPRPYLMISVADTGTGIAPENREKIFDPCFTTKEIGKGTEHLLQVCNVATEGATCV